MPNNQYNSKIILGSEVLMDLTGDTITPDKLAKGFTAHDKTGAPIEGTNTFDADTSDATAAVAEVLKDKTFYANGVKKTGTMPNNGKVDKTISTKDGKATIPQGYHDGSGGVTIDSTEQAKIISGNIKEGVTILGVAGTLSPGYGVTAQAKSVVPSFAEQAVLPDAGYDYLSQVTVAPISVVRTDNPAGGVTVTIGA